MLKDNKDIYYEYFNEKILPSMYPFEEERLKIVRKVVFSSAIMFLSGIVFAFLFIYISYKNNAFILLLPVFLFLMYVFFIKSIVNVMWEGKKYQKWLVENILPKFLAPVANFKFWPKNNDTEAIINSELFENFDTREDNNAIFGIYKNVNVIITETRLSLPIKGAEKPNLFKGTFIQLELIKSIENHVILISKNQKKVNKYAQVNPKIKELNKYLYVFAKNIGDTSFITEEFWNIIKRFGKTYSAKGFSLSYNNNVLLIGLEQKNPWEFGFLFKSLLKSKNYDDLIERFIVIYDLIDYLVKQSY